jgi:tetratricopeptide (TPR) repeat protein
MGVDLDKPWKDPKTLKMVQHRVKVELCKLQKEILVLSTIFKCQYCMKDMNENQVLQCSRCKMAICCSKDCQVKDWKKGGHKKVCERHRQLRKDPEQGLTQPRVDDQQSIVERADDLVMIGRWHKSKGNREAAIQALQQAVEEVRRGSDVSAVIVPYSSDLAALYFVAGRLQEAKVVLEDAIQACETEASKLLLFGSNRDPKLVKRYSKMFTNYGSVLQQLGDLEGANKAYDESLCANPSFTLSMLNKVTNLIYQEKYSQAMEICREQMRKDPGNTHLDFYSSLSYCIKLLLRESVRNYDNVEAMSNKEKAIQLGKLCLEKYIEASETSEGGLHDDLERFSHNFLVVNSFPRRLQEEPRTYTFNNLIQDRAFRLN